MKNIHHFYLKMLLVLTVIRQTASAKSSTSHLSNFFPPFLYNSHLVFHLPSLGHEYWLEVEKLLLHGKD